VSPKIRFRVNPACIGNELCGRRAGRIQWTVLWSCAAGSTSIVIFSYEFD